MTKKMYLFSTLNGVEYKSIEFIDNTKHKHSSYTPVLIDGFEYMLKENINGISEVDAEEYSDLPVHYIGSTDPYLLRTYVVGLFESL